MPLHSALTISHGIHGILAGTIANATNLAAGIVHDAQHPDGRAVTVADVGKVFQRLDNGAWYGLFNLAPANFWVLGNGALNTFEHGDLPGGTLHAPATLTVNGFYAASDKVLNDGHRNDHNNPHQTTAQQVGAIATSSPISASGTPSPGQVLTATSAGEATWQTPSNTSSGLSRVIGAGAGLTGGGDLTADRVINVGAPPDGSIAVNPDNIQVGVLATDAQHGNRGGGQQHTLATTSAAGFMSSADKTKLDGISSSATLSNATPLAIGVAAPGTSGAGSRDDHIHAHGSQPGGNLHTLATATTAGFMSSADKSKLDTVDTSIFARLVGGNNFTGNQNINNGSVILTGGGSVSATTGSVQAERISAGGSVPSFAGDIWANRDLRAQQAITAITGNISAQNGSIYTGSTPPPSFGDIRAANDLIAANNVTSPNYSFNPVLSLAFTANMLSDVQPSWGNDPADAPSGIGATWKYFIAQEWTSQTNLGKCPIFCALKVPNMSVIRAVALRIKPSTARSGTNRMRARLVYVDAFGTVNYFDVTPSFPDGFRYDDGTTAAQTILFTGLDFQVRKDSFVCGVMLYGGNGGTSGDLLYSVQAQADVGFFLPG